MRKLLLTISLLLAVLGSLKAQTLMNGYLLSAEDSLAISSAHIQNLTQKQLAISTEKGYFEISVHKGDTLLFSNLNYEKKVLIANGQQAQNIFLTPKETQLEEVVVNSMPTDVHAFKKQVLDMDIQPTEGFVVPGLPKAKPKSKIPPAFNLDQSNSLGYALTNPLQYTVRKFNKNFQEKARYYKLKANHGKEIRFDKKFNRELVAQLTNLDNEELTDFIQYLDIDPNFVIRASSYEIAVHIKDQFKRYTLSKAKETTEADTLRQG